MKSKIFDSLIVLAYAFLLCLCAALLCSNASAENAVDLANTEYHDGWLDACTLPDGGLVLAGYTEIPDASGADNGRILCLNPDRTVRWTYVNPDSFSYGTVRVTGDGNIAAFCYNGVEFFTPDGQPAGKSIPLPYINGDVYSITSHGILRGCRPDGALQAESLALVGWDGNVLFRLDEPESMWVGSAPVEEEDGLVLFGRASGDPAEAAAKVMKVDLQGKTVWETVLPFLSDRRDNTGVAPGIRTSDGGYLGILWDFLADPESGEEKVSHVLVKLDSDGNLLWMHPSSYAFWHVAESSGKYVGYTHILDPDANRVILRYLWLDADGNELGTTGLQLCSEDLPPHVDMNNLSVSVEEMIPMSDGLWQLVCFWNTDEPEEEEPAWIQQDNLLVRVPEL